MSASAMIRKGRNDGPIRQTPRFAKSEISNDASFGEALQGASKTLRRLFAESEPFSCQGGK